MSIEVVKATQFKHGATLGPKPTPEYTAWISMVSRCENPKNVSYKRYGGRGIAVCPRWRASFSAFLADMGLRPSRQHSLDRIDNNAGYAPENCRWATAKEQRRNSRSNRMVTYKGETLCVSAWCERFGLKQKPIEKRLRNGWTAEDAFTRPLRPREKYIPST